MSGTVKKIFLVLITIVALVIIGAFVLNTLLPNVSQELTNSVEDSIWKATGMSFDFNKDGKVGGTNTTNDYGGDAVSDQSGAISGNQNVEGFQ